MCSALRAALTVGRPAPWTHRNTTCTREYDVTWKSRHHQRGFLHRLDVPSSGLILVATSYTAYYDLRLQLSTGMISREYIALSHGLLRNRQVTAPVFWRKGFADASSVRPEGRPAISDLELMAKYLGFNRGFSLVRILIGTGRRHQIRVHTAHVGNPIVCDSKYAVWTTFEEDLTWCPRNFLHRHQLSFQEEVELFPERKGSHKTCSASEPLPEDLRCALEVLNSSWRSQRAGNYSEKASSACVRCFLSCRCNIKSSLLGVELLLLKNRHELRVTRHGMDQGSELCAMAFNALDGLGFQCLHPSADADSMELFHSDMCLLRLGDGEHGYGAALDQRHANSCCQVLARTCWLPGGICQ